MSWHEHLSKDEVPPEYLWEDSQGLESWWLTVEDRRKDGMPTSDHSSSGDEAAEDSPTGGSGLAQNDLARRLKQG